MATKIISLEQMVKDWKAATTPEACNLIDQVKANGVTKYQKIEFFFRNRKAIMEIELFRGDEKLPQASRRYRNTIFVPSTNKVLVIFPRDWKSVTERMMAILLTFTEGRKHEDLVASRKQKAIERYNAAKIEEYAKSLEKTTFTQDEINILHTWMNENFQVKHASWIDAFINVLTTYHHEITGRGLIEVGIDLGAEAKNHVKRFYDEVARCINASNHEKGQCYMTQHTAISLFLETRNVDYPYHVIRSQLSKIWDMCCRADPSEYARLFPFVCKGLGAFYAALTGKSLEEACEIQQKRFIQARNRRVQRELTGNQHPTPKPRKEYDSSAIITLGDAISESAMNEIVDRVEKRKQQQREALEDKKYSDGDDEDTEKRIDDFLSRI